MAVRKPVSIKDLGTGSTVTYYPDLPDLYLPIGAYVRLSLKKLDAEVNRLALDRQDVSEAVKAHGCYVAAEYCDPDHSAYKKAVQRPALDALLEDLDSGKIKGVAVYDIDRLTRRHLLLEQLIDRFERNPGLYWYCVDPSVDLRTEEGRKAARRRVDAAYEEAAAAQRRQTRRHDQLRRLGLKTGRDGFGYRDDKIEPAEAKVIRKAAQMVQDQVPLKAYLGSLPEDITSINGQRLTPDSMRRILLSPRIAGYRVDGRADDGIARDVDGKPIDGAQPEILSPEVWLKVRAVYASKKGYGRADLAAARTYLLSGFLRCGKCGYGLGGGPHRQSYRYYCPGSGNGRCGQCYINGPRTDAYVTELVDAKLAQAPTVTPEAEPWPRAAEMASVESLKAADMDRWQAGSIDGETWQDLDRGHVLRLAALRQDRKDWLADHAVPAGPSGLTLMDRWKSDDIALRRAVIAALLPRIVITPKGPWGVDRINPD
jgi:site-specific DNA recombinase